MSSKQQSRPSPWLNHPLEIHLDPFTINGRTYRVIGTESERTEYQWDENGIPHLVTIREHRHKVLDIETDERWWMPHAKIKAAQNQGITK